MDLNPSHSDSLLRREVRKRAIKAVAWEAVHKLFDARRADGMTQADLARELDKKASQVSRALSRPTNMNLETLAAYLDALGGYARIEAVDATTDYGNTAPSVFALIKIDDGPIVGGSMTSTDPVFIQPSITVAKEMVDV